MSLRTVNNCKTNLHRLCDGVAAVLILAPVVREGKCTAITTM